MTKVDRPNASMRGPLVVTAFGIVLAGLLWWFEVRGMSPPPGRPLELAWWVLLVPFLLTEAGTFELRFSDKNGMKINFTEAVLVVGFFFGSSPLDVLAATILAAAAIQGLRDRLAPIKLAFNLVLLTCQVLLAFTVFHAINPTWEVGGGVAWGAALAAGLTASIFTHFGVATVVCAAQQHWSWRPFFRPEVLTIDNMIGSTSLGIVSVVLLLENVFLVVFLIAPLGFMLLVQRHLAEKHAAERRSRESEALLQAILDNSSAVIYVKDMVGRYRLVNREWERVTGHDRTAAVGRTTADIFEPELAEEFARADEGVFETARATSAEETVRHDGEEKRFLSIRFPLVNETGEMYALCGMSTDITSARRLEEQMHRTQRMEAIGQLAGGVAHDFNNLLAVIHSYAQFVADDLPEGSPTKDDAAQILKAADAAANLTRQLLAFSRRDPVRRKVVDVNGVVTRIHAMLDRTLPETIQLRLDLYEGGARARVDEGQLEQVLMNLAVNARDAMPGGGSLTIATQVYRVTGDIHDPPARLAAGEYIRLTVTDTGAGIPPDVREHIFEPFFTTKDRSTGTGLGLATVYGIAEQSGGTVEVESEVGVGTRFSIYLPHPEDGSDGETSPEANEVSKVP